MDSPIQPIRPLARPEPVCVAVLPPRIHPSLRLPDFKPENAWYQRLADGRGSVVTSTIPEQHIALDVVATLTRANRYRRVISVLTTEDARRLGADQIMVCTIHDYRTVLLGANSRYPLMAATSLLMSQYWIRWMTLEARLDWEVEMTSLQTGDSVFKRRLSRNYTKTVRYAVSPYFTEKMLTFLRCEATPVFVGEMFGLEFMPEGADPSAPPVPVPAEPHLPTPEPEVAPSPAPQPVPPPPGSPPEPRLPPAP